MNVNLTPKQISTILEALAITCDEVGGFEEEREVAALQKTLRQAAGLSEPVHSFEAEVFYAKGRHFAGTQAGERWAITAEDDQKFSLQAGLTVVISVPHPQSEYCRVEYVAKPE